MIVSPSVSFPVVGSGEKSSTIGEFTGIDISITEEIFSLVAMRAESFSLSHIHHLYTTMGIFFCHCTIYIACCFLSKRIVLRLYDGTGELARGRTSIRKNPKSYSASCPMETGVYVCQSREIDVDTVQGVTISITGTDVHRTIGVSKVSVIENPSGASVGWRDIAVELRSSMRAPVSEIGIVELSVYPYDSLCITFLGRDGTTCPSCVKNTSSYARSRENICGDTLTEESSA